jgi:hypothetical protein
MTNFRMALLDLLRKDEQGFGCWPRLIPAYAVSYAVGTPVWSAS